MYACVYVCVAPAPNNVQQLTSNLCRDTNHSHEQWFYTRPPGSCVIIPSIPGLYDSNKKDTAMANEIVFVFQFPNPRDGSELAMSRLHQTMLAVFSLKITFDQSYSDGKC